MKKMRIKKLAVFLNALFLTTLGHAANTAYDSAAGTATIPEVLINGKVAYANAKLKLNPDGTFNLLGFDQPAASETFATYDPATGTLTIPEVAVNGKVEYVDVRLGFTSGQTLSILSSEIPQAPAEAPASTAANTTYDPATGTATISKVLINGKVEFVDVILKLNPDGTFNLIDFKKPAVSETFAVYDSATGTVTIPEVMVNDKVEYVNVRLGLNSDLTLLSVLSSEAAQDPTTPPQDTTPRVIYHSQNCSDFIETTYEQDDGETVTGMYCVQGNKENAELPAFTCKPEHEQLAKVEVGMTYDQVVELAGCHPIMKSSNPGKRISYFWGEQWVPDSHESTHEVGFYEGKIASLDNVYCGPTPCHIAMQQ
jgi:hypothetical protein